MNKSNSSKADRVLSLYQSLMNGEVVNKRDKARLFAVDQRTIQRDINDIKNFLADIDNQNLSYRIKYKRKYQGYILEKDYEKKLTNAEALAVCKVLLASRAFTREEMKSILDKIVLYSVPDLNQELINELIKNESFHYVELQHKLPLIDMIWKIGEAVRRNNYIEIKYRRLKDQKIVKRILKPLAITFSEYYFYLIAFIEDEKLNEKYDLETIIYRIDRIKDLKVLKEQFHYPRQDKFEIGEFKKQVQFMYGGKLQKITFKYYGEDIDMVLDRLPSAEILERKDDYYLIKVKVFGNGIDMWFKSQGEQIKIVERR